MYPTSPTSPCPFSKTVIFSTCVKNKMVLCGKETAACVCDRKDYGRDAGTVTRCTVPGVCGPGQGGKVGRDHWYKCGI